MTKENLLPYIEIDVFNFWRESINPINADSTFLQHGINTLDEIFAEFDSPDASWMVNSFLKMNYLLKGEYFMSYMKNMILTNRRLFIWFSDIKKMIPLCNLKRYEQTKGGLTIEYSENDVPQKLFIVTTWLNPIPVNNALNKYKDAKLSSEEITILSNNKPVLDSLYNLSEIILAYSEIESKNKIKSTISKPATNYSKLIAVCIVMLFIGGCVYLINNKSGNDTPVKETRVGYDSITGKKMKKCPWCGGIGRVGYAGESKAQVERTGMGLGNECTTCQGTGYVKDDGQ